MRGPVRALRQVRGRDEAEGRRSPWTPRLSMERSDSWLRLAVVRSRLRHAGQSGTIGRTQVVRSIIPRRTGHKQAQGRLCTGVT